MALNVQKKKKIMTTKKTTTKTMKKAEKVEAAHPAVLLDECGVTIVGVAPQLEWKDVISVANDKFDPSVKGLYFDAIRFTVRGGLKFCVRKEDVVWAENKEAVDTEDIRGMPRCTDEVCSQLCAYDEYDHFDDGDFFPSGDNGLTGKDRIVPSKNLDWAISFGDMIRGKGLALRICEESLVYEIAARLEGFDERGEPDFLPWLKPLETQLRIIVKGDFDRDDKTKSITEKKAIVAAFLSAASAFERYAFSFQNWDYKYEDQLKKNPSKKAIYKKLAEQKEAYYFCAVYDVVRNAEIWKKTYEHKETPHCGHEPIYFYGARMLVCSDKPCDFSVIAGVNISGVTIMSKADIDRKAKFPEGHPKEGGIYVQDAKDKNVYTELTEKNTGTFSKKEVKEILAKLKKILPDGK